MLYLGLMSGTSLDGIDAALVEIDTQGMPSLVASHYLPYDKSLQARIFTLSQSDDIQLEDLIALDKELGHLYAACCLALLKKQNLTANDIEAIGNHGQTIRHRPRPNAFSLQIGDANIIAELTGITTVADFRRRDIAAGGEGAPLVPAFHQAVFQDAFSQRQILNLGGIANITVLSQDPTHTFGFDLGPANALSNEWVTKHWQLDFDKDGDIARKGTIQTELVEKWLALEYFSKQPPKSTGRELFNLAHFEHISPEMNQANKADVLASLIELTAISIAEGIKQWGYDCGELYLCGGGAYNRYLVDRIQYHLPTLKLGCTDDLGIPADMVEACAFAWLAYRTMARLPGNLANATGAIGPRVLGSIFPA